MISPTYLRVSRNIRQEFDNNLTDYMTEQVISHASHRNVFLVVSNGDRAKYGSITSKWEHFAEWKRNDEKQKGDIDAKVLLDGMLAKERLLDLVENFILFDESRPGGARKIVARIVCAMWLPSFGCQSIHGLDNSGAASSSDFELDKVPTDHAGPGERLRFLIEREVVSGMSVAALAKRKSNHVFVVVTVQSSHHGQSGHGVPRKFVRNQIPGSVRRISSPSRQGEGVRNYRSQIHFQAWMVPLALIVLDSEPVSRQRMRADGMNGMCTRHSAASQRRTVPS